jgi:hypothetical protein
MWACLGIAELFFTRASSVALEITTRGGIWLGASIYDWYYPHVSETKRFQDELDRMRFELDELRNPDWVVIDNV